MRAWLRVVVIVVLTVSLFASQQVWAERATDEEMRWACRNWLSYIVHETGDWAGSKSPMIVDVQPIVADGTILGEYFVIDPNGYVVVPILKELPPVQAYSEEYRLDITSDVGFPALLKGHLAIKLERWLEMYGSLDATRPSSGDAFFGPDHKPVWERYAIEPGLFATKLRQGDMPKLAEVGPLLTTAWHQGAPYNNLCPMGDGGRCVVGCVATAAAQIMNYHRCPNNGIGSHSYDWDGDQSCSGDVGGGTLSADFSDAYDWAHMPDDCSGGCTPEEEAALAELCYEVGVALEMDYGVCGSGSYTYDALTVYPTYFGYDSSIDREDRGDHTADSWFDIIKDQINADQPMQYRIAGHSIVCDGWRDTGGIKQYHINYGWGGSNTGWFSIDNIPGSTDPENEEYLIRNIIPGCDPNDPPVALCKDVTVSANVNCEAHASIDNGSYDPDGDPITLTQSPPGPYPLGATLVTLQVEDDHGWVDQCTATVTVIDDTSPSISCPSNVEVEATESCGTPPADTQLDDFYSSVSASDNCDPSVSVTDDSPACFPLGTTQVTFTATDDAGNQATCSADVTVVDTTPPVITCPDDVTVDCNGPAGTYATDPQLSDFFAGVSATDVVDPNPVITNDAPSLFPLGTTVVTFTATDFSGNSSTCTAAVTVVDRGIDVWMEDLIVNPGDTVLVPIHVQDVTGWGLMAFEMQICWCDVPAGLLQYEECIPGEVMLSSGWGDPVYGECGPGCVSIAGAGAEALEGEGVLFYLKFAVSANAKPCMCCDIWFTDITLYDPEEPLQVCWQDGSVCVESCEIECVVNYWKCCYDECGEVHYPTQLADVLVHVTDCGGNDVATAYTDDEGRYLFDCLDPLSQVGGCYCVEVSSCPLLDCISSLDAALVLQNVVCLDDLDDCAFESCGRQIYPQRVAADVNCSGKITAIDASLILRYVVGLIDVFPCPSMWEFFALPCDCIHECPAEVNWVGVMRGDVTGCPACMAGPPLLAASTGAKVSLGSPAYVGSTIKLPVRVESASDVMAVDLAVNYDTEAFSVVSVEAAGLAGDFSLAFNPAGGLLRIAMAGVSTFTGDGTIATITLEKKSGFARLPLAEIEIVEAKLNDVPVAVEGLKGERRAGLALGPIAPNPFMEVTVIRFNMAKGGAVTVSIYNVNGQLVTTLVDGSLPAGEHTVRWDGRDNAGQKVARGVYFCRMSTADVTEMEKMVLIDGPIH